MSAEIMVNNCSPTLAGLKTGNMFNCQFVDRQHMCEEIREWNRLLLKKGIKVIPLRYRNGRALIYVYRCSSLAKDLGENEASKLLTERGYVTDSPEKCICRLIERICESDEFPHEVGLFLGYPVEDVKGFIKNDAKNCKCVGCWKVYGDEEKAKKVFEAYKKCSQVYIKRLTQGTAIEQLIVAG